MALLVTGHLRVTEQLLFLRHTTQDSKSSELDWKISSNCLSLNQRKLLSVEFFKSRKILAMFEAINQMNFGGNSTNDERNNSLENEIQRNCVNLHQKKRNC